MLSASAILSQTAFSSESTGDQFYFESLDCRNKKQLVATAQDLPDEILPVSVKDEGNENDPDTNLGMVIHEYSISQTEVTARQYCTYLNQVATGENFELFYNEKMGTDKNVASIRRDVVNGKNVYTVIVDKQGDRSNFPIVYVSLYQAARFCNWLQNQSTPGLTGDDLTERGAYTLDGKSSGRLARNPDAVWFIPTESEWYKPAYYKGGGLRAGYWNFANRSDRAPSNWFKKGANSANYQTSGYTKKKPPYLTDVDYFKKSAGAYNTLDMSGNVAEWVATEENQGAFPLKYVARGGSWKSLYYGTGLENKCDVANWGLELSKWSRPAYDPTQGYDNVGFRVATSLIVNSAPPKTAAPGATELTPTEIIEAPFAILAGIAVIFSGKKIMEYRQNAEAAGATAEAETNRRGVLHGSASQLGEQRSGSGVASVQEDAERDDELSTLSTDEIPSDDNSEPLERGGRRSEAFRKSSEAWHQATIAGQTSGNNSQRSSRQVAALTPQKLSITESKKKEIEQAMANTDSLFHEAVKRQEAIQEFLNQKGTINAEGLNQLQKMCDDHDAYAEGLTETTNKIKKAFPHAYELWIPWHTAAMDAWIETILLRHKVVSNYYQWNMFQTEAEEQLKTQAAEMRQESNQKTVEVIEMIRGYQQFLAKHVQAQEGSDSSGMPSSAVTTALAAINAKMTFLEPIEESIKQYEPKEKLLDGVSPTETHVVNGAYLDYAKARADFDKNLYPLYYSISSGHKPSKTSRVNLVNAAELHQQFQHFLEEQQVTVREEKIHSPGSPFPEDRLIYSEYGTPNADASPAYTPSPEKRWSSIYQQAGRSSIGVAENPMIQFKKAAKQAAPKQQEIQE